MSATVMHGPGDVRFERAAFYRTMLAGSPAGTPDEVAALAGPIMGPEGGYITGSDFLIDGGATADFFYGEGARKR